MSQKAKRKRGECYLCGAVAQVTYDHIPPRMLFPRAPDSVFLFAPPCSQCNNCYSIEESKFRDFLVVASGTRPSHAHLAAFKAMLRNFDRNRIGRAGRPSKDLLRIVRSLKRRPLYSSSGAIFLGNVTVLMPPTDIDYNRLIGKIARGLHFVHTGKRLPDAYESRAGVIFTMDDLDHFVLSNTSFAGNVSDFFHFPGHATEYFSVWYMVFYQTVVAKAMFADPAFLNDDAA